MNMKKLKAFFTLKRRANDGFTLVELIVVIAILAILGGVAVPAYSGYVKKANMQADITLASEVAHALTLQYYSDPLNAPATTSVVLSKDGATVADGDTFAADAMQATFGDSWRTTAKLSYDKWGNGAAVSKNVVAHFASAEGSLADIYNGTKKPSFATDVNELYAEVEDTAILWGEAVLKDTGASLMKGVASTTIGYNFGDGNTSNEDAFADAWANGSSWEEVNFPVGEGNSKFNAGANCAVIKARNTALGTYLESKGYAGAADAFMNYAGEDGLPVDIVGNSAAMVALNQSLAITDPSKFGQDLMSYFAEDKDGNSQAAIDGLAYYAMMDTVATAGSSSTSDDTYWNDMSGAVSLYASIAAGEANLEDLSTYFAGLTVGENAVAVTLIVVNGVPMIQTSPTALSAGE